jgi:hypothetical protein
VRLHFWVLPTCVAAGVHYFFCHELFLSVVAIGVVQINCADTPRPSCVSKGE